MIHWLQIGGMLCVWGAAGYCLWRARRLRRLYRDEEEHLYQILVLRALLAKLATESFVQHRLPVWLAWHGVFGEISVVANGKEMKIEE